MYLYGLTEPYDINEARERTSYFADQSERDLWKTNEILKHEIDQCSYSGYTSATIDISLRSGEFANYATASNLANMYSDAGYKTRVMSLYNGYNGLKEACRLEVSWEK